MTEVMEKEVSVMPKDVDVRKNILGIEAAMSKLPGAEFGDNKHCPLKHTFVDGAYVREIFMPKGSLIVSKIHKVTHPYFVMSGKCSVLTEEGIKRIQAPFCGITKAGTKRVLYIHEDCIWVTVHVTKETDLKKIEDEIIAPTYSDLKDNIIDVKSEEIKLMDFLKEAKKGEDDEKRA